MDVIIGQFGTRIPFLRVWGSDSTQYPFLTTTGKPYDTNAPEGYDSTENIANSAFRDYTNSAASGNRVGVLNFIARPSNLTIRYWVRFQ